MAKCKPGSQLCYRSNGRRCLATYVYLYVATDVNFVLPAAVAVGVFVEIATTKIAIRAHSLELL